MAIQISPLSASHRMIHRSLLLAWYQSLSTLSIYCLAPERCATLAHAVCMAGSGNEALFCEVKVTVGGRPWSTQ